MTEKPRGFSVPVPVALEAVFARLDSLSRQPEFLLQRQVALTRALNPYLQEDGTAAGLAAFPQEAELAELSLFCDFYPEDGQLTLIEQLRDVVTEHIPDEERAWLDPLKHSSIDLLELVTSPSLSAPLNVQSLGDGTRFVLPYADFAKDLSTGQILLTRAIREPSGGSSDRAVWAGGGLILSRSDGQALYERARDWERQMEMSSGELVLGEWQEFTKRYGHVLLWAFAEMRAAALADAVAHIRYRTPRGTPYLYAIAMYDHHEYDFFSEQLSAMREWRRDAAQPLVWIQTSEADAGGMVARLTLTSSQLMVECDSQERLNDVKHALARAFGFSLHFRGETVLPPNRRVTADELMSDQPITVVIQDQDDRQMLNTFLEKAYLEWSDQPHGMLKGQTPRHAAAHPGTRHTVSHLIMEMEASDLGLQRTGDRAYDYNVLRGHVGIDEAK